MIRKCWYLVRCLRNRLHAMRIRSQGRYEEKRRQYMLVRSLHGLEKGLCLPKVRMGFGVPKIEKICRDIEIYENKGYDLSHPAIRMAMDALAAYFAYHEERGYKDDAIMRCKEHYERMGKFIKGAGQEAFGGILHVERADVSTISPEDFHNLVSTRHSVRSFDNRSVPLELIQAAVNDAMRCPSACNRQPTKVYVVTKEKQALLLDDLKGIGGFSEDVDKYIAITGDIAAFDANEDEQWIVNAGIFAGYLTLALHVRGIASCVIQRNLHWGRAVKRTQAKLGIPPNEQIVVLLAAGMYPERLCVPVSYRYDTARVMKEI